MGASVSLQGRFCHDMDPDYSILVSSLGYIEIIRVLSFSGAVLGIVMDCLFQFHYNNVLFFVRHGLHFICFGYTFRIH